LKKTIPGVLKKPLQNMGADFPVEGKISQTGKPKRELFPRGNLKRRHFPNSEKIRKIALGGKKAQKRNLKRGTWGKKPFNFGEISLGLIPLGKTQPPF